MAASIALLYLFLQKYLVPLLFVIGIMHFVYGSIEYFFAGRQGMDEHRAQNGRVHLLKSVGWFFVALVVYCAIAVVGWLGSLSLRAPAGGGDADGNFGVDLERDTDALGVPNVPRRNQ